MSTPAIRNNNPGNLKDPSTGQFRQFSTPQEGYAALLNDLQAKQTGTTSTGLGPNSSLVDFASKYAPANDRNNVGQYAANLANQLGVAPTAQLRELDLAKWAAAVAKNEDANSIFGNQRIVADKDQLNQEQPKQSFIKDVGDTARETYQDVKGALAKGRADAINPLSTSLQTAGAIAGGVNQFTTDVLHHIPVVGEGVQKAEEYVGKYVQKGLETDIGQKGLQKYGEWAQEHPEAAGNIGAATNIAMAVPIVKGALVAKSAVKKGIQTALKGSYDDIVEKALQTVPKSAEVGPGIKGGLIQEGKYGPELMPDPRKQLSTKYLTEEMETAKFPKTSSDTRIAQFADDAGDAEAIRLEKMLDDSEVQNIVQPEDLQGLSESVLKRADETLATGDKPAQQLLDVFYKNLPKDREILPGDILRARRAVGRYIIENRGDWSQRGVYTGFKSARDAFWDESRTLLQRMAPDVDVLGSLEKQTSLYRVIDYMKPKVLAELKQTQRMKSNFFERHPLIKGAIEWGAPSGILPSAVKGLLRIH